MSSVIFEQKGRVALLRLNEPQTMNALSAPIKAALSEAIPRLLADPEIGCLVLTGTDRAFCAGGDLRSMQDRRPNAVRARIQSSWPFVLPLLRSEKPVVAAVNGAAAGAGLSLALLADIVIASEEAIFRGGFAAVGAVPDLGLAYTLPRAVGWARACDLLMTNRAVDAAEAAAIGLASRVVPAASLMDEALALAGELAEGPASLGMTKTLLTAASTMTPEDFLGVEAMLQAQAFGTGDFAEGVAAFLEKRRPVFPHN